jgi:hypothetical protein
MFDIDTKTKVFLTVMGWAFVLYLWRKRQTETEYQSHVLSVIALALIGILTLMLANLH